MDARRSVVLLVSSFVAAACGAPDDPPQDATTGATSDTTAGTVSVEQCPEFPTQAECEAATDGPAQAFTCAWFEVRVPGPTCASDVVVAQCVGLTYVGEGCQAFECEGPGSSATVDGFFREVDGAIQVFANPPTQCGRVAIHDGWAACTGDEAPPECSCLCDP